MQLSHDLKREIEQRLMRIERLIRLSAMASECAAQGDIKGAAKIRATIEIMRKRIDGHINQFQFL